MNAAFGANRGAPRRGRKVNREGTIRSVKPRDLALAVVCLGAGTALRGEPVRIDVEGFYGVPESATSAISAVDPHLDFRSVAYYGGGVNLRWSSAFSTVVSAASMNPGVRLTGFAAAGDFPFVGTARTTPLSLIVQWHPLGESRIDPYVGAGASWVLASDAELLPVVIEATPIVAVALDDRVAFVAEAGARLNVFGALGVLVDVRYMPLTLDATVHLSTAEFGIPIEVEADPFLFGFGLSLRF